jgi:hypothetical protein
MAVRDTFLPYCAPLQLELGTAEADYKGHELEIEVKIGRHAGLIGGEEGGLLTQAGHFAYARSVR